MLARVYAGFFAVLLVVAATPSQSAEKTFQDATLDDAAITLEAEVKDEAGGAKTPLATLKKDADALLRDNNLVDMQAAWVTSGLSMLKKRVSKRAPHSLC